MRYGSLAPLVVLLALGCDPSADGPQPASAPAPVPASTPADPASADPAPAADARPATPREPDPPAPAPTPDAPGTPDPGPATAVATAGIPTGNAREALAASLAAIPGTGAGELAAIEKTAWAHYKAEAFHEASEAFARLTKLDPAAWKHPFNAACAAGRRGEIDRAQMFLVEALRRDAAAARPKAERDGDLRELQLQPWYAELLAADAAALDAWVLRPPRAFELQPYAAGAAPFSVRELSVTVEAPTAFVYSAGHLEVGFTLEAGATWKRENLSVFTRCEAGERQLVDSRVITAYDLEPGASKQVKVEPFNMVWPFPRKLERCELTVAAGVRGELRSYRSAAQWCYADGQLREGGCGFARPEVAPLRFDEGWVLIGRGDFDPEYRSLDVFVAITNGPRPDVDRFFRARFTCDVGGKQLRESIDFGARADQAQPGDSEHLFASYRLEGNPTRCEVELIRSRGGPQTIDGAPRYCWTPDDGPHAC